MNDVARSIEHDVPIVSVLDLEKEAEDRIGSHAFDEVTSSLNANNTIERFDFVTDAWGGGNSGSQAG